VKRHNHAFYGQLLQQTCAVCKVGQCCFLEKVKGKVTQCEQPSMRNQRYCRKHDIRKWKELNGKHCTKKPACAANELATQP
jgi:hypothetical protein